MPAAKKIFNILKIVVITLTLSLIILNLLYIKAACYTKNCLILNIATILLLLWAAVFWIVVLKHSNER